MHDWTLISVSVAWEIGSAEFQLIKMGGECVSLSAERVIRLVVPHKNEWGPSVSINEVRGPTTVDGGMQKIEIEMQSGDLIEIIAERFHLPSP